MFITDKLFIPRYIWFKIEYDLPFLKEKVTFFEQASDHLNAVQILYFKGEAKMFHLDNLARNLS